MLCLVMAGTVMRCHALSCLGMPCHMLSCIVVRCHAYSCCIACRLLAETRMGCSDPALARLCHHLHRGQQPRPCQLRGRRRPVRPHTLPVSLSLPLVTPIRGHTYRSVPRPVPVEFPVLSQSPPSRLPPLPPRARRNGVSQGGLVQHPVVHVRWAQPAA